MFHVEHVFFIVQLFKVNRGFRSFMCENIIHAVNLMKNLQTRAKFSDKIL